MAVDVQFNLDQAIAKLGELVSKHGPQAVDLAASVVQVDAMGNLIRGGAFGVAALVATALCFSFWRWILSDEGDGEAAGLACLGSGAALVLWVFALVPVLNVWNWVALYEPRLALAHEVLNKVGL